MDKGERGVPRPSENIVINHIMPKGTHFCCRQYWSCTCIAYFAACYWSLHPWCHSVSLRVARNVKSRRRSRLQLSPTSGHPPHPPHPPACTHRHSFLVNHWLTISSMVPAARWRQRSKAAARRLMSCRAPAAPVRIKTRAPSGGVWTVRSSIRFKSTVPLADAE